MLSVLPGGRMMERVADDLLNEKRPLFSTWEPDWTGMEEIAEEVGMGRKVLVVGSGGSQSGFHGIMRALGDEGEWGILHSQEPRVLREVRRRFPPGETTCVVVSKSGETLDAIEGTLLYKPEHVVGVLGVGDHTLGRMFAAKGWKRVVHAPISGRFSGMSETAIFPVLLSGVDVRKVWKGAKERYDIEFSKKGESYGLAKELLEWEENGLSEVFGLWYSSGLYGFSELMTALVHETYGKAGRGITYVGGVGPEIQHNSIQRILGGRRNQGVLVVSEGHGKEVITVDEVFRDIESRGRTLGEWDGMDAERAFQSNRRAVVRCMGEQNVRFREIVVDEITPESVGGFMAFLHCFSYFSARLRGMEPFDQPEVERMKELARENRFSVE